MKASLLFLALVPAFYAAPALPDHSPSAQPRQIGGNKPNAKDVETGEMIHTHTDSKDLDAGDNHALTDTIDPNTINADTIDPETGESIPNTPIHSEGEQLRMSLFLELMANLTSNLISTTDQLAEMNGKSLLDVIQFPPSSAPIWINSKRQEHKTTWQEVTAATLDGIDVAIKEMEGLAGTVTGQEMSQIANAIGQAL